MCGSIDAASEARDDGEVARPQVVSEKLRHALTRGRGVAGTDDRDGAPEVEAFAADYGNERWRAVDVCEQRWVVGLTRRDETAAELVQRSDLLFGFGDSWYVRA